MRSVPSSTDNLFYVSCRSLILKNVKWLDLQNLADKSLRSLSLQEDAQYRHNPRVFPRLAILTGVTRLELLERNDDADNSIQILRRLQLQELVLIDCRGMAQRLFVPGALTTIKRLHIERSHVISEEHMIEGQADRRQQVRQGLEAVGDVIFSLPNLYQVSGTCTLFLIGMRQGLKSWMEADFIEGTMVSCESYHCCLVSCMKVWTKPHDGE